MINCQKLTKGERQWKIRVIRKRRRRSIRIEKKQEMMPDFLPGDVNKKSKKKAKKLKNERLRILSQAEIWSNRGGNQLLPRGKDDSPTETKAFAADYSL